MTWSFFHTIFGTCNEPAKTRPRAVHLRKQFHAQLQISRPSEGAGATYLHSTGDYNET